MMDWRWQLFCINAAYCHMIERENYESYYFNRTRTKTNKHNYMIKEAAGYGEGKRAKSPFFFSKQHYVTGLSL